MKEERFEKLFSELDLSGVQSWSNQDRNDMTSFIGVPTLICTR